MFDRLKLFLLLLAGVLFSAFMAFASQPGGIKTELYFDPQLGRNIEVTAGQILVKFKPAVSSQSISALNSANNVRVITRLPSIGVYNLGGEKNVAELMAAYDPKINPDVEYACPNHIGRAQSTTPNDANFSKQWGLTNIKAPQTWDIQKGASSVIIAVVDSGTDMTHEDLKNRVIAGYDYIDNDNDPSDEYGHGTHVAGIIGAQANNTLGVAGVNWDCRLLIVRVLGSDGKGNAAGFVDGVNYAANHGAKVINLSLALDNNVQNPALSAAILAAHNLGCVIVAAAGNDGNNGIFYPGGDDNVICVAAVDQYDVRADYSNYNSKVAVCAPGGLGTGGSLHSLTRVYSTMPSYDVYQTTVRGFYKNYDSMHGTSMATPFVSGFAGLLFAQNPTWTNTSVEAVILSSVDHLGSGAAGARNDQYGYGRINMYKAFNTTPPTPPSALTSRQNRDQVTVNWTASTQSNLERNLIYRSNAQAGPFTLIASVDATQTSYTETITQEGTYYYKVSALDASGLESTMSAATAVTVAFSLADVYIYPNPLTLVPSAEVVFGGLNGNETIRLYTLTGEFLTSAQPQGVVQWKWNARNAAGRQIAPGIYLYLLTRPTGEKRIGKIAVIGKI